MHKLKVLLADDHDGFRRILVAFLKMQKEVEVVEEATDGRDVVEKTEQFQPDLILMDIHMPQQNGIEATKTIKSRWPATRVFILSMDVNEFCQKNAQEYADGFIAKSSLKEGLLALLFSEQQIHCDAVLANACAA
jgi:two-component system, NarL family, response regulator DegU